MMLLLALSFQSLQSKETLFVTLNTVRARPLALGGAFVTFADDLAALSYNPAGFRLKQGGFSWFINPVGAILSVAEKESYSDNSVPVSLSLSGVGFAKDRFQCGVMLGEESFSQIDRIERGRFFDVHDYQKSRNVTLGFSVTLAPKVSIGMAGEWYLREGGWRRARFGHRYGLIVRPRPNTTVGLCYFDLAEGRDNERLTLDRFSDEALNIGISHAPREWLTVAVDVRNVSDEGRQKGVEPHAGIEIRPLNALSLRGGYYQVSAETEKGYSAGFGISDIRTLFGGLPQDDAWRIRLEATVIWQKSVNFDRRWILTSIQVIL